MKKVLFTLLVIIVALGALAGVGYAGYRVGYNQGATASGYAPFFGRGDRINPHLMPGFDSDYGFYMQPYRSPMMGRGAFGFNMFSPLHILWNIAILALIVWFVYWLFNKSGWRITREARKESEISSTDTEG